MNDCGYLRNLMSPMLDGELSAGQADQLIEHIKNCETCYQEWQAYEELNERLRKNIHLPSIEAQCFDIERVARLQMADTGTPKYVRTLEASTSNSWHGWVWLVALVACLTIMFTYPEWRRPTERPVTPQLNVIGRLIRATGAVEVREPGSQQWQELLATDARPLLSGAGLRTRSDVLCEVETSEKGLIRLGQLAEIEFQNESSVKVVSGRVWCRAPSTGPIELDLVGDVNSNVRSLASLTCPGSSEMQCVTSDSIFSCQAVPGNPADVRLTVGQFTCPVAPGETVSIDVARQIEQPASAELNGKIWQLPLLAIDASSEGELMQLMRPVLASLGMSKVRHMNEVQLRALGPIGAIPLLVYAQTESAAEQAELRRRAVWLAGEIADERSLPWLSKLADDADTVVADYARSAASRLTK